MNKKYTKLNKGSSTLEILIAFTVLILCMSAVIMIIFSNQSVSVDTQTNHEAIYLSGKILEDARATSRQDFISLISTTSTETLGGLTYTKKLSVDDLTQCKKQATVETSWSLGPLRPQEVELTTFLTDILEALALGGDCDTEPLDEWDNPVTATSVSIGGQGATDIDVRNDYIYLTSSPSSAPKEDFFIYKFDPILITLTEMGKINVSKGLNGVDTIENYAFVINSENNEQFMVFDVSDPTDPIQVATSTLPNTTTGIGRSINYYNGFVYIGTQYQSCPSCSPTQNNEFHIYDVSTPASPNWVGSYKANHNVNDIVVRGNYAYLATSADTKEIIILNISNPSNITEVGLFNAQDVPSGAGEDATSLYLLGTKLYFGRERAPSTRPDFYVLDISNPTTPTLWASKNLGMNPASRVTGVIVKSNLAFVGLDDPNFGLKIIDISTTALNYHPTCTTLNFSENSTAMDMEKNSIFSASQSNDEIRVIRDQVSICS